MACEVRLSVRALVEFVWRHGSIDSRFSGFDRANEGSRIHRKLQKNAGEEYQAEVVFKGERTVDGVHYRLEGRADGVLRRGGDVTVDEIKTTAAPAELLTEDFEPLHWAQAKCYGALLCAQEGLPGVTVQITYYQIDTDEIIRHRRWYEAHALEEFLLQTLHLYAPWAEMQRAWQEVRTESLRALTFPFAQYRPGQYALAGGVYRAVRDKKRLLAMAPTGIGKTASTLFPALKAMGEGCGERIFYLTAKTVTRQAALDALRHMRRHMEETGGALRAKCVVLTAKDKICPLEQRVCSPQACPRADGYYDRINAALYRFLQQRDVFSREEILAFAEAERLCPFELSLDLANWCDCIVCDYNYLFDPVVSLKRFFADGGDFVFLIDEAHNLVDRARDMYSARLEKSAFYACKKALGKTARRLTGALTKLNSGFLSLRRRCEEAGGRRLLLPAGDDDLAKLLMRFCAEAEDYLDEHREGALHDALLAVYFDARFYLRIWELYDERFTTLVTLSGSDVAVELLCLDASEFLDASLALGRAGVLFSATLSPAEYFLRTLGLGENAQHITLPSPFDPNRLCLLCADSISTKYADRARTLDEVCRMIEAAVRAKKGNYLVFLPSYQYLSLVSARFSELFPDIETAVQQPGMDEAAREDFLAQFSAGRSETLAGFCVLGGVFSEGIDLVGERLIGCVIVGVGLPQIGPVQDALRDYYEETLGAGFDYAYRFPGMNKVLQAAGRVIRTPQDKGLVLLIDSRYAQSAYRRLFPAHWAGMRRVADAQQAAALLKSFWGEDTP